MKRVRLALVLVHLALGAAIGWLIWRHAVVGGVARFTYEGADIDLSDPRWLMLAVLIPYFSLVASWSLADLPRAQRFLSFLVRSLLIVALALALARPVATAVRRQVCTVFLVDVSESVTDDFIERSHAFVERALQARGENLARLVTFARRPRRVPLDEGSAEVPPLERHTANPGSPPPLGEGQGGGTSELPRDSGADEQPDGSPSKLQHAPAHAHAHAHGEEAGAATDIQAALQLAYGLFPPGTIKRVVLLSDGNQTNGDLLAEASRARELGVRIHEKTFLDLRPREALVSKITMPDRIRVGEPFELTVHVWSSHRMDARVTLYQGDVINGLDGIRNVTLEPGENRTAFQSVSHLAGPLSYRARLDNLPGDRFADNNAYAVAADVVGRPTVCYVEGEPASARFLQGALTRAELDVEVRGPRAFPRTLREMERFDAIILSDVPAENVSMSQMQALEQYVRDVGGGFIMTGGPDSFGMGGYYGTIIERILPVRFDTERRREQPVLALALVIDKSGSMTGTPVELAKEAARATAAMLAPDDLIEVIAFDARPTTVVRLTPARNRSKIQSDIARLSAGGGTNIFPALDQAYRDLSAAQARTKHVILLSDGQSPTDGISELIQVMAAEGITVSTVGLGPQADRALLQSIADEAGGRFHHTNDPYNIPRIFTRETSQVTRSAVVEEFFQPVVEARVEMLRGIPITSAPFLRGYVSTRMRPPPAELILSSDIGEPLLARMRVGLGQTVAWTSDVKNRWAVDWLRWPGYGTFWAQVVRETMRQRRAGVEHVMRAEVVGGTVHVTVDAQGADDTFINGLQTTLRVIDPGDADHPMELSMRQTAPGWYEARFPMGRAGTFLLRAEHRNEDGRVVATSGTSVASPYPAEYLTVETDRALLEQASRLTSGAAQVEPTAVFDAGDDEGVEYHRELWPYLVALAVALMLLDLLLRRVRLFDRQFKAAKQRG
jgi:Mg-chelatase subunit ChlD